MKYLDIKLAGHDFVRAFTNEKKTDAKQPDYKGDGIAVWVRESKNKENTQIAIKKIEA